jgi:plastocyanin
MRTWYRNLPLLVLGVALLAGCSSDQNGEPPSAAPVKGVSEITAKDLKFSPAAVEVPAGTTVTWKFDDRSVPHDVKADGWNSGKPRSSGTFSHTFSKPGSYDYVCSIHPKMTGRVVVTSG